MTMYCRLLVAPCEIEEIVELLAVCQEIDEDAGAAGDMDEETQGCMSMPIRRFVRLRGALRALGEMQAAPAGSASLGDGAAAPGRTR